MHTYKHILLAAQYTQHNALVAQRATDLAGQFQARLSILHVIDDIALPDTSYGSIIPLQTESDNAALLEVQQQLARLAQQLGIAEQHCWLIWGNPKHEIELFAEKIEADLIVVGSHEKHGFARLLGSTANSILHHAQCDVMSVRLID